MKKAFDQTVRDLKREVNKKVLKVPGIEQKVLDATSNEPWGPHGSLLADIAHATRNYHEYQIIMSVIWRRINDSGKNWLHVYKSITVLDYLVAHGSERVIDEIREHAYQLSTLSHFQYIDSNGRDQGSNVRKKSQSLMALVNDKERIVEVKQKAAANRDKFHNTSSGGTLRPGSYSSSGGYGHDRYDGRNGSRDDDRNGYGREREWGYKDDRYSRDGDSYGREYEERLGRDSYRNDDYRGRSRSVDENQYGSRSMSADRDNRFSNDGQYSNCGSTARADDQSQDGSRRLERKFSEQNIGAPPSYEETITESRSPVHSERDGETPVASAPRSSSPSQVATAPTSAVASATATAAAPASPASFASPDTFDGFDPRDPFSAAQATSNNAEMDLLGALSDSLAIVPATSVDSYEATHSTPDATNHPFRDPFGDSPFKAIPSSDNVQQIPASVPPFHPSANPSPLNAEQVTNFDMGDSFSAANYPAFSSPKTLTASEFLPQELLAPQQNMDILADILPPPGPSPHAVLPLDFSSQSGQSAIPPQAAFTATASQPTQPNTGYYGSIPSQVGFMAPVVANFPPQTPFSSHMAPQIPYGPTTQVNGGNFDTQQNTYPPVSSQVAFHTPHGPAPHQYPGVLGGFQQQAPVSLMAPQQSLPSSTGSLSIVPQPSKEKFETRSTVWADTLSRGLVNLNISGSKTNPLADIGIDFEAMNRKEKRMEKPTAAPVTSTVTMGRAMGSGSGMGRAAASGLRPPANPIMGSNIGMGVSMGMMGMGSVCGGIGMGQQMGMGQPMGMNMDIGMNMGTGQGFQMRPPTGPPGSTMPGSYNPMIRTVGYAPQQPCNGSLDEIMP